MKKINLLIIIFLILFSSCNNCLSKYNYRPPVNLDDGFNTGTLESVNIDAEIIQKAVDEINCGKFNEVHSMLIYKDDKLVFEEYFKGHKFKWEAADYYSNMVEWDYNMPHHIMSCTKSITSACVGIAIEKGFIDSVHQSIFDYLPNHQQFNNNEKNKITIEHLLTMTSGLQWNEWNAPHGTAANDIDRLYIECYNDPLYCVLERPMVSNPGQSFTYNGGGMIILGEIIKNATKMNIVEFARMHLFEPLGIDSIQWHGFPKGEIEAAGGLVMSPRDMLKLGVTYLNEGTWNGNRIITPDWVERSSIIYGNNIKISIPIEDSGKNGYGYTWWISEVGKGKRKTKMYRANGWGGQVIMVFPELDMVIVFTGGNYAMKSRLFKIVEQFILQSIK